MEANKTVLQMKYARIVSLFSKETGMPLEDALSFFYNSTTYEFISEGVADMHCPMHVGRLSDKGGNWLVIKWFGDKTNLHTLWDSKLVESAHAWSYTEWQQNLDRCTKSEFKEMSAGTPEDWLTETWKITVDIYANVKTDENYSYKYVYDYAPVVERQFLLAGYRLAALLNRIFG